MKTKSIFLIIMLCIMLFNAFAQEKPGNIVPIDPAIKKVNIGQQVPDYILRNLVNYPQRTAKMTDFKGKILIFDFWTFGCVSCVESWPKLMKLQEQFKDKIQIIIVNTDQTEDKIAEFIKRQEKINKYKMTLTGTSGDKNLTIMFPHQAVPHVIFINPQGIVTNITAGFMLHQETIEDMLEGKTIKTPVKTDDFTIAYNKPMFINGNYGKTDSGANVLGTTIIAPYTPEVMPVCTIKKNEKRAYGVLANYPISAIFSVLYGSGVNPIDGVRTSRIIYRGTDSVKLVARVNGILKPENLYCLQLTVNKPVSIQLLKEKMIRDFEFTIGYKAHWEKQKKVCVVFSKLPNDSIPTYKTGERKDAVWGRGININNISMDEFLNRVTLNIPAFYSTPYPFVDETGISTNLGNIRIESPDEPLDLKSLIRQLSKYGFQIRVQERVIDVLVIEENKLPVN